MIEGRPIWLWPPLRPGDRRSWEFASLEHERQPFGGVFGSARIAACLPWGIARVFSQRSRTLDADRKQGHLALPQGSQMMREPIGSRVQLVSERLVSVDHCRRNRIETPALLENSSIPCLSGSAASHSTQSKLITLTADGREHRSQSARINNVRQHFVFRYQTNARSSHGDTVTR